MLQQVHPERSPFRPRAVPANSRESYNPLSVTQASVMCVSVVKAKMGCYMAFGSCLVNRQVAVVSGFAGDPREVAELSQGAMRGKL